MGWRARDDMLCNCRLRPPPGPEWSPVRRGVSDPTGPCPTGRASFEAERFKVRAGTGFWTALGSGP